MKLDRNQKAAIVCDLHKKGFSIRQISEKLDVCKSHVHRLLIFSRIPNELAEKYAVLSLKSFVNAATRASNTNGNLEEELEKELIKKNYSIQRRRLTGLQSRFKVLKKELDIETDLRRKRGLMNKINKIVRKLNEESCPPQAVLLLSMLHYR